MISIKGFIKEIEHNATHHPDPSRRSMYLALYEEYFRDRKLTDIIIEVQKTRSDIDDKHFANLITHAFEIFFIEDKLKYSKDYWEFNKQDWTKAINEILEHSDHGPTARKMLLTKKTQTNKYQRYLGPKILVNLLMGNRKVSMVDAGCSLNYGLMALKAQKGFMPVKDHTSSKIVSKNLNNLLFLKKGYGIDIEHPEEDKEWVLACSFYPSEIQQLPEFKKDLNEYKKHGNGVSFIKGDIAVLDSIWEESVLPKVDVLLESTVLYQLKQSERENAMESGKKIIKEGGMFIINDFSLPRYGTMTWDRSWFGKGPNYITSVMFNTKNGFTKPMEFLRWKNARCLEAYTGRHFKKVMEVIDQLKEDSN